MEKEEKKAERRKRKTKRGNRFTLLSELVTRLLFTLEKRYKKGGVDNTQSF